MERHGNSTESAAKASLAGNINVPVWKSGNSGTGLGFAAADSLDFSTAMPMRPPYRPSVAMTICEIDENGLAT